MPKAAEETISDLAMESMSDPGGSPEALISTELSSDKPVATAVLATTKEISADTPASPAVSVSAGLSDDEPAAEVERTAATIERPTDGQAKPLLAVKPRVAPVKPNAEFTTDDALEVVAEAQQVLVAAPRSPVWGRLWWLARIASQQARAFSNEATPAIEMVTAEEPD